MLRKIRKQEAIALIRAVNELEIQHEIIFRTTSPSKKSELQRNITELIASYVRDNRDVVVLAIKVK
jgi:hypothetical protein